MGRRGAGSRPIQRRSLGDNSSYSGHRGSCVRDDHLFHSGHRVGRRSASRPIQVQQRFQRPVTVRNGVRRCRQQLRLDRSPTSWGSLRSIRQSLRAKPTRRSSAGPYRRLHRRIRKIWKVWDPQTPVVWVAGRHASLTDRGPLTRRRLP